MRCRVPSNVFTKAGPFLELLFSDGLIFYIFIFRHALCHLSLSLSLTSTCANTCLSCSESVSIPKNPRTERPVGYAFVDLSTPTEADRAVTELSGKEILERKVSVQLARKPEAAADKEAANGEGAEGTRRQSARGRGRANRGRGGRSRGGATVRNATHSNSPNTSLLALDL